MSFSFSSVESIRLKDAAAAFSAANPVIAPLLARETADPDAERIFDALIYQNQHLHRKLEADFPEFAGNFTNLVLPHYLRQIPASTMMAFTISAQEGRIAHIPSGTLVSSSLIDGASCIFVTAGDLEVHPVELTDVRFSPIPGDSGRITITLASRSPLAAWRPRTLSLFLSGDHASACDLYYLLRSRLSRIILTPIDGSAPTVLPPECLKAAGFDDTEALIPYPPHVHPGYRHLQEYFANPGRFLMLNLTGWDKWTERGGGTDFTISFEFSQMNGSYPRVTRESFTLNAVPAVNTFPHSACPIILDHRADRYLLRPAGINPFHYRILSVDGVTGVTRQTGTTRSYRAFDRFGLKSATEPVYHVMQRDPAKTGEAKFYLGLCYPGNMPLPDGETLSIALTCTNGSLPENLHIGDIRNAVSALPEGVSFRNVTAIMPCLLPPAGHEAPWRLTSHMVLNHQSLGKVDNFRALLELYVFTGNAPDAQIAANRKRINGIESVSVTPAIERVEGVELKGREIRIRARQDHFAGPGDLYLFGCILASLITMHASQNAFTRLMIDETTRGGIFTWPARFLPVRIHEEAEDEDVAPSSGEVNAFNAGEAQPGICDDLVRNGHAFSFPQVMRLVGKMNGNGPERVRLRSELSLSFPAADIARVALNDSGLTVEAAFLRILDSLPTHYAESLIEDLLGGDSTVCRDFIEIFQERLYELYFDLWRKYQLHIQIAEEQNSADLERLLCLTGFGMPTLRRNLPEAAFLPRYTGLFSSQPRSAAGLRTLLRDAFGIGSVEVEECVLRKVTIPRDQRLRLGMMRLGVDTVLGGEIKDRSGKFRIHIGPLRKADFNSFLPGSSNYGKLVRLIKMYIPDPFEYDLNLTEAAGEARPIRLGDPGSPRLGWGSWLLSDTNSKPLSTTIPLSESNRLSSSIFRQSLVGAGFKPACNQEGTTEVQRICDRVSCPPLAGVAQSAGGGNPQPPPSPLQRGTIDEGFSRQARTNQRVTEVEAGGMDEPMSDTSDVVTFTDYYQKERANQHEPIEDFLAAHPDLAPLMNGHIADPGIERVKEGAAFCNAQLKSKIDDDFPEIIHPVMEAIAPNSLRPIPATTIVAFRPSPSLSQPAHIKAGAEIDSIPVEGTKCRFRTCFGLTVHPLTLTSAAYLEPSGQSPVIRLQMELNGVTLKTWKTDSLRLFLSDDHQAACNLYLILMRYVKQIYIVAESGEAVWFSAKNLNPYGFNPKERMLAHAERHAPAHTIMQEYFLFPDKFMFLELTGLAKCRLLGEQTRFTIDFELDTELPFKPDVTRNSFTLHTAPVINLFDHKAKPMVFMDEVRNEIIEPEGANTAHYQIYSVDRIEAQSRERSKKSVCDTTSAAMRMETESHMFHITKQPPFLGHGLEMRLSAGVREGHDETGRTKLAIALTCTNARLPEKLGLGDVCIRTGAIPESLEPVNIKAMTYAVDPIMQLNGQWKLLSAMNPSRLFLENVPSLRAVLWILAASSNRHYAIQQINQRRLDGIVAVNTKPIDRLMFGKLNRGCDISILLDSAHFAGPGDMYLFASVLERFMGGYVTQLFFVRVCVENTNGCYRFQWPERFGDRPVV